MSDKPRGPAGIVDPWKRVEPLRPTPARPEPRPGRKDIEDVDLDADLAIPGMYTIRSEHTSFTVVSTRVSVPKDSLDVLADCVAELFLIKKLGTALLDAGIGVKTKHVSYNIPTSDEPSSVMKGSTGTLWFIQKPLDEGLLLLGRIMRESDAVSVTKKHGITVML